MTNLTSTYQLIKKTVLPAGVILLIIILIIFIVFRFRANPVGPNSASFQQLKQPIIKKIDVATGRFTTQNLSLPQQIPETLMVYKADHSANFLNDAGSIATKLGFNQQPDKVNDAIFGTKLNYSSEKAYLGVYQNGFYYTNLANPLPQTGDFSQPTTLKNNTLSFLAKLDIKPNISDKVQARFYQISYEQEVPTDDPQKANKLVLKLNYEISGIKVIGKNTEISASFNRQNYLLDILYNHFSVGDETGQYPVIDAKSALNSLFENNGALMGIENLNIHAPNPKQFDSVDLKNAYLAYNQPDGDALIQPLWLFEGTTTYGGDQVRLTYAVPAIEQKYFQNPSSP